MSQLAASAFSHKRSAQELVQKAETRSVLQARVTRKFGAVSLRTWLCRRWAEGEAELLRDRVKAFVAGPQSCAGLEQAGGKECGVDEADAAGVKTAGLHQLADFVGFSDGASRKPVQKPEDQGTVLQRAERDLTDDEGVTDDLVGKKATFELRVA